MTLEIRIQPQFLLDKIKHIENTSWLELPSVELIRKIDDPANVITISEVRCIVKGTHLTWDFEDSIKEAYRKSFNSYKTPFYLDSLLRFSPYCQLSQALPPRVDCTLVIEVDYIEKNNNVTTQKKKPHTFICVTSKINTWREGCLNMKDG